MAIEERDRARLRALCGELHDDDGVDPRDFFQPPRKRDKSGRKSKQLCRQVEKTLDLVLSGEMHDELLGSLHVVSVTSGSDLSALVVTVVADVSQDRFDRAQIEDRLAKMSGRLRSEVARAITRKRTPLLIFHVLGPQGGTSAARESLPVPEEESR